MTEVFCKMTKAWTISLIYEELGQQFERDG